MPELDSTGDHPHFARGGIVSASGTTTYDAPPGVTITGSSFMSPPVDYRPRFEIAYAYMAPRTERAPADLRIQAMRTAAYIMSTQEVVVMRTDPRVEYPCGHDRKFKALWHFLVYLLMEGRESTSE